MISFSQFISELLQRNELAIILVIASSPPDWIAAHAGPVLLVSNRPPERPFKSADTRFLQVDNTSGIVDAIETICIERQQHPVDIVFIDHDHRLRNLVEQINIALSLATERTLFLFDDAVPPTIDMAGPMSMGGWYVGEVRMLRHLLRASHDTFFAVTCKVAPTALLAAAGFSPLNWEEFQRSYDVLNAVGTDEELERLSNHVTASDALSLLGGLLRQSALHALVEIQAGGKEDLTIPRITLDEPSDWQKTAPDFTLNLSTHNLDYHRLSQPNRRAHGKFVDTFEDAYVLGPDSILTDGKHFDRNDASAQRLQRIATAFGTHENRMTIV